MEYIIIEALSAESLSHRVNKQIEDGWICQGGVSFIGTDSGSARVFAQAMIKEASGTRRG